MKWIVRLAGLAALGALAFGASRYSEVLLADNSRQVPTIKVQNRTLEREVACEGVLKAETATPITVPRSRRWRLRIAWIEKNGTRVKKGDPLVRFNAEELERNLASGIDSKKTVESKLAVEKSRSLNDFKTRERNAKLAKVDLQAANARKASDNSEIFSQNELLSSSIDRQLSEARVRHAGLTNKMNRSVSRSKLSLLALEKKAADIEIESARDGLSNMNIMAPHDGLFVHKSTLMQAGATVYRGQEIANIPSVNNLEAKVFVLERDVKGLKEGARARVVLESRPEASYSATIKTIDALAKPRFDGVPTQYFEIILQFEQDDMALLKPGLRVKAALEKAPLEGIVVPRQCVFSRDGDMVVFKKEHGVFRTQEVSLGPGTPGMVLIEEGLQPGDLIASQDPLPSTSNNGDSASDNENPSENTSESSGGAIP